jgi:uncharacterized membrane protein
MSTRDRNSRRNIRIRKVRKNRNLRVIFICIIALLIGWYILEYVATMEKPPLGSTFNILLGCVIIAVSLLFIFITVKKQYFPKKRRRTNHVFLEDQLNEMES